jgi:hypothetical protein
MTPEQMAAFRTYVKALVEQVLTPRRDASIPELMPAREAFGIAYNDYAAQDKLRSANRRCVIGELRRRGLRPNEPRARSVARNYVKDYIEWGMIEELPGRTGGGRGTYAFLVSNGRSNCPIHEVWEERPGYIIVSELYLQPCCFHFSIEELRFEIEGNRVHQLSLGLAS